ncbi:MAG TPA: hypothetical protein VJS20_03580 [Gemmatimonadales bacterium]|nr:hypothetical protein [Gemmatimonadales bacterium]
MGKSLGLAVIALLLAYEVSYAAVRSQHGDSYFGVSYEGIKDDRNRTLLEYLHRPLKAIDGRLFHEVHYLRCKPMQDFEGPKVTLVP